MTTSRALLKRVGLPTQRAEAVATLAAALAGDRIDLSPGAEWGRARRDLAAIPGIGARTLEIIAMRALGDPDAFPATDLGVRRALDKLALSPARSERWRPWRSYATQYLWAQLPHPMNHLPTDPATTRDEPRRTPR